MDGGVAGGGVAANQRINGKWGELACNVFLY